MSLIRTTEEKSMICEGLLQSEFFTTFIAHNLLNLLNHIFCGNDEMGGFQQPHALNKWSYLTRYVDYGEAEIDNNLIENQILTFALGHRNWLFIGNERSANTASFFVWFDSNLQDKQY